MGLFIDNSAAIEQINDNRAFAALPANEWNKSFGTKTPDTPVETSEHEEADFATADQENGEEVAGYSMEPATVQPDTELTPSETMPAATELQANELTLTNVSLEVSQPAIVKQVIINEEQAGVLVTKAYKMTEIKGEWKMEPLWMISELKLTDSLKQVIKKDSTIINIIPTVR